MRYKWVIYYCGVPDTWTQSGTASWKTCKGSQTSTQRMSKQWLFKNTGRLVLSQQATRRCKKKCWNGTKAAGMVLTEVTNQASLLHQHLLLAVAFRAILRQCIWLTELSTYLPHPVLGREKQEHLLLEHSTDQLPRSDTNPEGRRMLGIYFTPSYLKGISLLFWYLCCVFMLDS